MDNQYVVYNSSYLAHDGIIHPSIAAAAIELMRTGSVADDEPYMIGNEGGIDAIVFQGRIYLPAPEDVGAFAPTLTAGEGE